MITMNAKKLDVGRERVGKEDMVTLTAEGVNEGRFKLVMSAGAAELLGVMLNVEAKKIDS